MNKKPGTDNFRQKGGSRQAFTLVEVLLALAIAAIGFGVVLHSVGLQLSTVSTSIERHQMLMFASQALETSMARGTMGEEEEIKDQPIDDFRSGDQEDDLARQSARFVYSLDAKPVTADPRVQQVSVTVKGSRGVTRLAAYRLRVKRQPKS